LTVEDLWSELDPFSEFLRFDHHSNDNNGSKKDPSNLLFPQKPSYTIQVQQGNDTFLFFHFFIFLGLPKIYIILDIYIYIYIYKHGLGRFILDSWLVSLWFFISLRQNF
jgi:hypothetical protein